MEKTDTETTTGETMKIQMGRRQGRAIALGVLILALVVGACGGGGDDEQTPQAADKADSTELGEVPQADSQGSIKHGYVRDPYSLNYMYTFE